MTLHLSSAAIDAPVCEDTMAKIQTLMSVVQLVCLVDMDTACPGRGTQALMNQWCLDGKGQGVYPPASIHPGKAHSSQVYHNKEATQWCVYFTVNTSYKASLSLNNTSSSSSLFVVNCPDCILIIIGYPPMMAPMGYGYPYFPGMPYPPQYWVSHHYE